MTQGTDGYHYVLHRLHVCIFHSNVESAVLIMCEWFGGIVIVWKVCYGVRCSADPSAPGSRPPPNLVYNWGTGHGHEDMRVALAKASPALSGDEVVFGWRSLRRLNPRDQVGSTCPRAWKWLAWNEARLLGEMRGVALTASDDELTVAKVATECRLPGPICRISVMKNSEWSCLAFTHNSTCQIYTCKI